MTLFLSNASQCPACIYTTCGDDVMVDYQCALPQDGHLIHVDVATGYMWHNDYTDVRDLIDRLDRFITVEIIGTFEITEEQLRADAAHRIYELGAITDEDASSFRLDRPGE